METINNLIDINNKDNILLAANLLFYKHNKTIKEINKYIQSRLIGQFYKVKGYREWFVSYQYEPVFDGIKFIIAYNKENNQITFD